MSDNRHLSWDGAFNARDLGGLRAVDGRRTRWRAVVRSERPDGFSEAGWSSLHRHGIRTIVDLRSMQERPIEAAPFPVGVDVMNVELEDYSDNEFWMQWRDSGLWGTPLYFPAFLSRYPERCAEAVAAVAQAGPGGVLVCCGHGRDRTGLVVMLLLALVGVVPDEIACDYALSSERLGPFCARLGHPDEGSIAAELLRQRHTSAHESIVTTLATLDVDEYLRGGGLSEHDAAALHARLLVPALPVVQPRVP